MTQSPQYDIFISYRTTHRDWVEILARNLKAQNYRVFLDSWELIPGQSFTSSIFDALKNSRCAILVATPDATESGWVQTEYELMFNHSQQRQDYFFIPIVLGEFPDLPFLSTIQAVDFKNSHEDQYREAFQRLLCGLKQQPPGYKPHFSLPLIVPELDHEIPRALVKKEQSFIDAIFMHLDAGDIIMLLSQADSNPQIYAHALRQQAELLYGNDNVLHISPPASTKVDTQAYFSRIAQQCNTETPVEDSNEWCMALAARLDQDEELFLLVSGFENGEADARRDLASEIRALNERYPFNFHPVIMGSEKLAAMKYELGDLSMLNIAQDITLPDLSTHDLKQIFSKRYPQLSLNPQQLQQILDFTGSQPRLVHYCLQAKADNIRTCQQTLLDSPLPAQLFTRFQGEEDLPQLSEWLQQTQLGNYSPWPANELLRRLYWHNLICHDKGQFVWRCEFIQKIGRRLLGC